MFQFADRSMKLFKGQGITNRKKESSGNKTKFWVTDAGYLKEISGGSFTLKAGRLLFPSFTFIACTPFNYDPDEYRICWLLSKSEYCTEFQKMMCCKYQVNLQFCHAKFGLCLN